MPAFNPNPPASVGQMTSTTNQTLETLLVKSGSVGIMTDVGLYTYEDLVFEKYYNADYKASELNVDFTNYANFVFYGTAAGRLRSFANKIYKIESLQKELEPIFPPCSVTPAHFVASGSIKYGPVSSVDTNIYAITASAFKYTGSADTPYFIQEKTKEVSLAIEGIIRGFDPYEQYLFFETSNEPYSASFSYAPGGVDYHLPASWPKNAINQVYSPLTTSASTWYDAQMEIAERYDQFNANNLIYTVPLHILDDDNSVDFITFVSMIGHFFDTLKPYIDQYTEIFDRGPDPNVGLSKELINEVAHSFGIELPNLMAIRNIQEYISGTDNADTVKDATAETWKRLLHNLTYIQKTKGTRASIEALFRSLGFHPALISVKETGLVDAASYQIIDEFTNALRFTAISQSVIQIPQLNDPQTLQFRFSTDQSFAVNKTSSIFTGDVLWKAELVAHPTFSNQQRVEIKALSGPAIISSSYTFFNDGEFYDVMLRKLPAAVDLTIIKNDGGEIIYSSSNQEAGSTVLGLWDSTSLINIGGFGPLVYRNFEGIIDEVRLWGEVIGDSEFLAQTNDPGSFVGNSYSSSIDQLYFQLSFLREDNLTSGIITNESPYTLKSTTFPTASALGFVSNSDYIRMERLVRYNLPTLGASSYISSQIRVPEFTVSQSNDASGQPTLYTDKSHTLNLVQGRGSPLRQVSIAISPTDFVNQRISRAFGAINLTDAIGDPAGLFGETYAKLEELKQFYATNFTATVDTNKLITIFETLISNLRDYIEQLIPAHSNLLFGILVEPNILERKKINYYRSYKVDGSGTRTTDKAMVSESYALARDVTYALEDTIETPWILSGESVSHDIQISGFSPIMMSDSSSAAAPFYNATIEETVPAAITGSYNTYSTFLSESVLILEGLYPTYTTIAHDPLLRGIPVLGPQAYPSDSVDLRVFPTLDTELDMGLGDSTIQNGLIFNLPMDLISSSFGDDTYYRAIPPLSNFNDIGVTTYFNNPDGIYLFSTIQKSAIPTGILRFPTQSWASGNFYSRDDVVRQTGITGTAEDGNERYYRLIANTSNPVASFVPPYLDGTLWEPVRFTAIRRSEPKRIVFDQPGQTLLDVVYSRLNIIDPTKILATNNRAVVSFSGLSLTSGSSLSGAFNIQNIFALLGYQSTMSNIRLRLFRTSGDRDSTTSPLIDLNIQTTDLVPLAQVLILYNSNNPVISTVYFRLDNLDSLVKNTDLTFYYFGIDAKPLVPLGYLPRHYKFHRDNSTATKRHCWLGCLQTQNTTLDGGSPIQITVSPSSDLIVAPSSPQTDLTVGGGGTLNVT